MVWWGFWGGDVAFRGLWQERRDRDLLNWMSSLDSARDDGEGFSTSAECPQCRCQVDKQPDLRDWMSSLGSARDDGGRVAIYKTSLYRADDEVDFGADVFGCNVFSIE